MIGKKIRLGRIFRRNQRSVIVPIDQSITSGPIRGIVKMRSAIRDIMSGSPDAMLMQRGPVSAELWEPGSGGALIVHLSAATELSPEPNVKTCVCSVETALKLGADAVSVHISLGTGTERDNQALGDLGRFVDQCARWDMPLLAMMYVYGSQNANKSEAIIHAARIGAELGADMVKVNYTGDQDSFARLVELTYVPVVVAGGSVDGSGHGILRHIEYAMKVGAAGACVGRNVYQHDSPSAMTRAISAVVHRGYTADAAFAEFVQANSLESARQLVDEPDDEMDNANFGYSHSSVRA